ncbi:hypothetical protein GIB67_034689 [Kingdonia uniflora]|uniref:CCHC-type domain-containing protein n=1 Tax=Kingdonia uniflora TaxID=39325 RepID=A0A7J7P073_9MAGN|nr:hypothetical protein GIB67_034689 [Kingdonia uniflora]
MKPAARKILSDDRDNHEQGSRIGKATEKRNRGFLGPQKYNRLKKVRIPQTLKMIKKPDFKSPCLRCGAAGHWFRDCKTPWVPRVKIQDNHITTNITSITKKLEGSNFYGDTDARIDQQAQDMNAVNNVIPRGATLPFGSPFPGWSNWMLLMPIPMILPFFKSKWGPLLLLKQRADTVLQEVEDMAELAEDVARMVDHIADEVTEKLPEGSKLKKAISMVDHVVKDTIKVTDLAEEIIDRATFLCKLYQSLLFCLGYRVIEVVRCPIKFSLHKILIFSTLLLSKEIYCSKSKPPFRLENLRLSIILFLLFNFTQIQKAMASRVNRVKH